MALELVLLTVFHCSSKFTGHFLSRNVLAVRGLVQQDHRRIRREPGNWTRIGEQAMAGLRLVIILLGGGNRAFLIFVKSNQGDR